MDRTEGSRMLYISNWNQFNRTRNHVHTSTFSLWHPRYAFIIQCNFALFCGICRLLRELTKSAEFRGKKNFLKGGAGAGSSSFLFDIVGHSSMGHYWPFWPFVGQFLSNNLQEAGFNQLSIRPNHRDISPPLFITTTTTTTSFHPPLSSQTVQYCAKCQLVQYKMA